MSCLPTDNAVLAAIRDGRRSGTLTLDGLGRLVAHLRGHGHSPRLVARAAGLGCAVRRALADDARCPLPLHDVRNAGNAEDPCACDAPRDGARRLGVRGRRKRPLHPGRELRDA